MPSVYIAGAPGAGKSTIMRAILPYLGTLRPWRAGLVHGLLGEQAFVLGVYPAGEEFGGTDRLSMAVLRPALEVLPAMGKVRDILAEGDRLNVAAWFDACTRLAPPFTPFYVEVPPDVLEARRLASPRSSQSASWRAGRVSKVTRMQTRFPGVMLDGTDDPAANARRVLAALEPARNL